MAGSVDRSQDAYKYKTRGWTHKKPQQTCPRLAVPEQRSELNQGGNFNSHECMTPHAGRCTVAGGGAMLFDRRTARKGRTQFWWT